MSYNAVTHFFADADSNPVPIRAIFLNIHDQIFIRIGFAVFIYKLKLRIFFNDSENFIYFLTSFSEKKRSHYCDLC